MNGLSTGHFLRGAELSCVSCKEGHRTSCTCRNPQEVRGVNPNVNCGL